MATFKEVRLTNGLQILFEDESNRYFGDYHRVSVVATIVCNLQSLPVENPEDEDLRRRAFETFGEQLSVVKRLERMGVSSADVERTRDSLVEDFLQHSSVYLSRPTYLRSLVSAALKKKPARNFYG